MTRKLRSAGIASALWGLLVAGIAIAGSADPAVATAALGQVQDGRPEVAALLVKLADHAGARGEQDAAAVETIDKLIAEFKASGPKDRAAIADGVAGCLEVKRLAKEEAEPDRRLFLASAVALGEMGPESVKPLIGAIGNKRHRHDIDLQRKLILSLGKTADPKAADTLVDLLTHKDAALVGAAAEALGNFGGLEGDRRKDVFQNMLEVLMSAKGAVDLNVNDNVARERYNTFSAPMITSLGRLAKHEERDPEEWQRWWNKNKKRDWDAPDPASE